MSVSLLLCFDDADEIVSVVQSAGTFVERAGAHISRDRGSQTEVLHPGGNAGRLPAGTGP